MTNFENPISRDAITEEEIQMRREQFKAETEEYKNLLKQLRGVEGLELETESPKVSLAFLIEETKKKNLEGWQVELKRLKKSINKTKEKEGEVRVSWLLSELISTTYIDFLEKRKGEVEDEGLKEKIGMIKKMAERSLEFNRKAHEQGQPVAFGGVSLYYVPNWYYYSTK